MKSGLSRLFSALVIAGCFSCFIHDANAIGTADGYVPVGSTSTTSMFGVYGGVSIGTSYISTAAPTDGLIVSGSVGIGTSSPGTALDILRPDASPYMGLKLATAGYTTMALYAGQITSSTGYVGSGYYNNSSKWRTPGTAAANIGFSSAGSIQFYTNSGLTANTDYTPTMRMIITSAGTVGIGTGSPASLLHVNGVLTLGVAGSTLGQIDLKGSTSGTVSLKAPATAGTTTFTLPGSNGTSGYFLQTDGNGVTTWAASTGSVGGAGTANYVARWTAASTLGTGVLYDSGSAVGIGTDSPGALVDINGGSILFRGGLTNTSTRPAVSSGILSTNEIRAVSSSGATWDDGFLRISAGGGTSAAQKTYIDITGFSSGVPDMLNNIVFGAAGVERVRISTTGMVVQGSAAVGTNALVSDATLAAKSSSGTGYAVYGSNSSTGSGVYGVNTSTGMGVLGSSTSSGIGVYGSNDGTGAGVYGTNTSTGAGVSGTNSSTGSGVSGSNSSTGYGIYGSNSAGGTAVLGYNSSTGYAGYFSATSGTAGYFTSDSGYALITGAGNVGIGTASPSSLLHVNGTATFGTAGATAGQLVIAGSTSGSATIKTAAAAGTPTFTLPTTVGTSGYFLQTDGTGILTWATPSAALPTLTSAYIWVGNGSNVATAVALSGDCTLSNAGAITCTKTGGVAFGDLATLDAAPAGTLTGTTLAANVVTSSLTTVGTIATGVWHGTAITVPYGGTGLTSLTSNVIYKGNGTSALTASGLTDNGTTVSSTENVSLASAKGYMTEIANATTTGTTANRLAKLSGGSALIAATTDTDGMVGVVMGGAGTAGSAQIAVKGQATCYFENATTAGDYVTIGTGTAGACRDAGATRPTTSQSIGRVLAAVAAGNTATVVLDVDPSATSSGAVTGTGTANYVARWTGTSALGTGALYDNGTNVSVGTTSVGSKFNVYGGATIGTSYVTTAAPTNGLLVAGKVGIGTNSPGGNLDVVSTDTSTSIRIAATSYPTLQFYASGGAADQKWWDVYDGGTSLSIRAVNDAFSDSHRAMTITRGSGYTISSVAFPNSGVAIGSDSPTSLLTVNGNAAIGTAYVSTAAPANGLIVQSNVGIGTASPSTLLHVNGTATFGTAGATAGQLVIAGSTSGSATIKTAAAAGTPTFTLPTTVGTSGYFLQTDGTGLLTWAQAGAAGTVTGTGTANWVARWTGTSSIGTGILYDNGTAVGINAEVSSTDYLLFAATDGGTSGNTTSAGFEYQNSGTDPFGILLIKSKPSGSVTSSDYLGYIAFMGRDVNESAYSGAQILSGVDGTPAAGSIPGYLSFITRSSSALGERMRITSTGNIGIGTSSPSTLLHVNGTATFGTAGSTAGQLVIAGSTSGSVTIKAAAAAGTPTFTLPTTVGTSGYFLQTNGSGVLTWAQAGAAGTVTGTGTANYVARWTGTSSVGTGILYDSGTAVGIGTTSPLYPLTVYGNNATNVLTVTNDGTGNGISGSGSSYGIYGSGGSAGVFGTSASGIGGSFTSTSGTGLYASSTSGYGLIVASGSVGIGTAAPQYIFHTYQNSNADEYIKVENAYSGKAAIVKVDANSYYANFHSKGTGILWVAGLIGSSSYQIQDGTDSTVPFTIEKAAPSNALYVDSTGYVGIGTSAASTQLHVNGTATLGLAGTTQGQLVIAGSTSGSATIKTAAAAGTPTFTLPTTVGTSGYFLQTDGTGILTWATPSAALPTLTSAYIWVGNASNVATAVALSGDCTLSNAGAISCTKTNGTAFGSLATLSAAPAGTLTGTTLAANVVTSSLTSVGTITSGVWHGTAITVPYGGTGLTTLTSNVIYKGNGASALAASGLTDNGTTVSSTENVSLASAKGYMTEIANATTTGTTANRLAKLSGGSALIAATTDTDGIVGVVMGGAGTAGSAQIAVKGQATCYFENATTAGDYVTIGTGTAGACRDAGATRPTTSQSIGRVLAAVAAGNTATVVLDMDPSAAGSGAVTGTGTANYVARWTGTSALGTGALYDNGTNVSVGTTSVGSKFNVYGGATIGTSYVATAAPANGLIVQGSVGIGTSSPGQALDVLGLVQIYEGYNTDPTIALGNNGWNRIIASTANGKLVFFTAGKGISDSTTPQMLIDLSGNVGIGTTALSNPLGVYGAATIGTSYIATAAPTNGLIVQGNVGVGTSTVTYPLTVVGSSATYVGNFTNTASGGTALHGAADSGAAVGVYGSTASTTDYASGLSGEATGATGATIGVWGQTSSTSNYAAGIWGNAEGTSGITYGVWGRTFSTTAGAAGIIGQAKGATGATYAVYGSNASATGYGGYFYNSNGGYAAAFMGGNVGIGTASPSSLLHVNGTATFGTSGATAGQLVIAGSTSGSATIKTAAAAGTPTFTLPTTVGTSGYFLQTDGTGILTWAQAGAAGTVTGTGTANYVARWTGTSALGTGALYDNGTAVGVGTSAPTAVLQVSGATATPANGSFTAGNAFQFDSSGPNNGSQILYGGVDSTGHISYLQSWQYGSGVAQLTLNARGGNVGIGTTSTANMLTVSGGVSIGTSYVSTAAPTDGLIVSGSTAIGTTVPVTSASLTAYNTVAGGWGVYGRNTSGGGAGVQGYNSAGGHGVFGQASSSGRGVYGLNSGVGYGVYGRNSSTGYAGYFSAVGGTAGYFSSDTGYALVTEVGNVGIGTTAPTAGLDIVSKDSTAALKITNSVGAAGFLMYDSDMRARFYTGGGPNWAAIGFLGTAGVGFDDSTQALTLITNNAARVTIDTSGNVGIGTASPIGQFDVYNATYGRVYVSEGQLRLNGYYAGTPNLLNLYQNSTAAVNSGPQISFQTNVTGGTVFVGAIDGIVTDITSASVYKGALVFRTANSADPVERMRIDSSGNVGIGTNSPSSLLHVNGTATLGKAGSTAGQLVIAGSTSGSVTIKAAAAAGTPTFTLPTTVGTSGYFLQTNGSGVLTWAAASGGLSGGATNYVARWTSSSSLGTGQLYDTGTKVGIGTTPTSFVTVYGSMTIGANFATSTAPTNGLLVDGSTAIGTTVPTAYLTVETPTALTSFTDNTKYGSIAVQGPSFVNNTYLALDFLSYDGPPKARIGLRETDNGSYLLFGTSNNYDTGITNTAMTLDYNGYLGVGTGSPSTLLHVNGTATFGTAGATAGQLVIAGSTSGSVTIQAAAAAGTPTFTLPTTVGTSGYFLQTDGTGILTWAAASGGGLSGGTANWVARWTGASSLGTGKLYDSGTYVGIGTSTVANLLTIKGSTSGGAEIADVVLDSSKWFTLGHTDGYGYVGFFTQGDGTNFVNTHSTIPASIIRTGSTGGLFLLTSSVTGSGSTASLSPGIFIGPTGKVAIGATSLASNLSVDGNASIGDAYQTTAAPTDGLIVVGSVGIATSSPSYRLHVNGAIASGKNSGNQGQLVLLGSTSGSATIKTAAAAGTPTFTLPTTVGTSGYFLQTNGSGVLTWAAASGGSLSGGTANYVARWTGASSLGTGMLYDSGTTLGINAEISSSDYLLYAATDGSISGINAGFEYQNSGTDPFGILLIKSKPSGSVTSSDYLGYIAFMGRDVNESAYSGAQIISGVDGTPAAGSIPGYLSFVTRSSSALGERMRITSDGKVAIGTTTAYAPLHVNQTSSLASMTTNTAFNGMVMQGPTANSTTQYVGWDFMPSGTAKPMARIGIAYNTNWGTSIVLGASNSWATGITSAPLTVAYNGGVGVGTSVPQVWLHVYSSASPTFRVQTGSYSCDHSANSSSETVSCSSDARLKDNIVDTGSALQWLGDMRVRDFTLKAANDNVRHTGVIAQEIQKAHPEMVHLNKDGYYTVDEPDPWRLVKAIQELKNLFDGDHMEIERLKAENAAQAKDIQDLKALIDKQGRDIEALKRAHP